MADTSITAEPTARRVPVGRFSSLRSRSTKSWSPANGQRAEPEILVNEGFRSVARVSADGALKETVELKLPAGAAVTYLRAASGEGGTWYAAASLRGRQVSRHSPSMNRDGL